MAFGGKREKGARKEKNDCRRVLCAGDATVAFFGGWEDRRERNVRNRTVMKKATIMTARGDRMMSTMAGSQLSQDRSALQLQQAKNESHPKSTSL